MDRIPGAINFAIMGNEFASKELPPERSTLLPVLIVLSYINTGFFLVLYGFTMLAMIALQQMPYDEFEAQVMEQMESIPQFEETEGIEEVLMLLHSGGVLLFALLLARTIARLIGVIMMHRRRVVGFYVYAAAQLIGLFLPYIVMPWSMFGLFGPIMVVAMVALYGSQQKWLRSDRELMPVQDLQ